MPLAYLSSPYHHEDPRVMESRYAAVCEVAGRLIAEGVCVFSTIAHNVPIVYNSAHNDVNNRDNLTGWRVLSKVDREILKRCDRLIVLMLDGWDRSRHVSDEIEMAIALGIEIEYMSFVEAEKQLRFEPLNEPSELSFDELMAAARNGSLPLDHSGTTRRGARMPEAVFAEQWITANKRGRDTLSKVLGRWPTQEEADAVANAMRWLGSAEGQRFIRLAEADIERRKQSV